MNKTWRTHAPNYLDNPYDPNNYITCFDIPITQRWQYFEFLYEELREPRNKYELDIKKRYAYCYEQSKRLGLSAEQYIGCGVHKQVFLQQEPMSQSKIIKVFCKPIDYRHELKKYQQFVKGRFWGNTFVLPHEYHMHYSTCELVEIVSSRERLDSAIQKSEIINTEFVKKVLKVEGIKLANFGFYHKRMVCVDVGDYGKKYTA